MKGHRGRRNPDTRLAPVAHPPPVKASPGNPALEELVLFPSRQYQKRQLQAHQQRLDEVKRLIRQLRRCCRNVGFQWPVQQDLDRLDDLVSELAGKIRKRLGLPLWRNYKAVDDHWHLKLWKTIEELVERAVRNTPPRPVEKYNRMLSNDSLAELTKKFFGHYAEVIHGGDPSSVAWEQFDDLFKQVTRSDVSRSVPLTSRLGEVGGAPELIAYTVFLEFYCDDSRWIKSHWAGVFNLSGWVSCYLQHASMLKKLSRFLVPSYVGEVMIENTAQLPEFFAEKKKAARRARDLERKRRKK
jgi:hypothetical protein